jgi:prepilin-type N-terminal cleavage/methylation domain-containing protein
VHGDDGFTLVELLVVVLVIGALVGIAVPTFVKQRDGAWDAAVRSELRAASIALASYRAQNGVYSTAALASGAGWGFEPSPDILTFATIAADAAGFCVRGWYRTSIDGSVSPTATDADARADWAATPSGIVALTGTPRTCPS